ncbi:hypothetical protein ACVGXS_00095, partial [Enterobacter hormaechei]
CGSGSVVVELCGLMPSPPPSPPGDGENPKNCNAPCRFSFIIVPGRYKTEPPLKYPLINLQLYNKKNNQPNKNLH